MKKSQPKHKHYCDSCVFIGFLNEEPDKFKKCKDILEAAEQDYIELYTSAFAMAEVVKVKIPNLTIIEKEELIDQLFSSPWINLVQFERETAEISRYLFRIYGLKPFDSLHLATAIRMKVDYFNTTDTDYLNKFQEPICYLPNYPKKIMIQEPSVEGYQPLLF